MLDETSSTQDDARLRFDGTPVLVVAASQNAGRGRSGAEWRTAPRALAASLAFEPPWPPESWPLIPLVAGVAITRTLDVSLKWPNDVVRGVDKLGGILTEGSGSTVVAGLGLNLWWPDPPEGAGAVRAGDPGEGAAGEIARAWCDTLLALVDGDPAGWPRDEYRAACVTLDRPIVWEPAGSGTAVDVDAVGGLVVETDAGRVVLRSGEVRHIR
jgi:BirA family transcriptional regulator, biotin operon repressor / biotin---[acetyl-CoA-carboxylase] ligase